jgi:hypothetical protein
MLQSLPGSNHAHHSRNRHTLVTELSESGADDEVIMSIAGHVPRAMLSRYSHVRMEAKRRALDKIAIRQIAARSTSGGSAIARREATFDDALYQRQTERRIEGSLSRNLRRIPRPITPNSRMPCLSTEPCSRAETGSGQYSGVAGDTDRVTAEAFDPVMTGLGLDVDQRSARQTRAIDHFRGRHDHL